MTKDKLLIYGGSGVVVLIIIVVLMAWLLGGKNTPDNQKLDKVERKVGLKPGIESPRPKTQAEIFAALPDSVFLPGKYVFNLKAGQATPFRITFPLGMLINYSIKSADYNYKLVYDDGDVVKDGKNVIYPNKITDKFNIVAITDQPEITMIVIEGKWH